MNTLEIAVAVAAGVILFLFGIENFSKEVQAISGERFRKSLSRATRHPALGFLLGASVTALIQSSTATSVIAVGLVDAGVLSFRHALGILFGANVGTTVTAQLVALKLTDFAPYLILAGFVAGLLPFRWRILGRSIFYFGLVFFSLDMVSAAAAPLREDPDVVSVLASFQGGVVGVLAGALFTAVVQSSSVTTGLAIVLTQQGILRFDSALAMVLGANVGTTITAVLASANLDTSARRTAISHVLYNVLGVALFVPFLKPFEEGLLTLGLTPPSTLAVAHLVFNLTCAVIFLAAVRPFARLVERLVPDEAEEPPLSPLPARPEDDLDVALADFEPWLAALLARVNRYYTSAVLALETQDDKIVNRARRMSSILHFGLQEAQEFLYRGSHGTMSEAQSTKVLHLVISVDHVRQLVDSMDDLMGILSNLERRHARLSMDALLDVQRVWPLTGKTLEALQACLQDGDRAAVADLDQRMEAALGEAYLRFIELARREREGSELADFLSIHQRIRSKVEAFANHLTD
ncbi:MAG: Na/Pi cotransporter family protein [Myxococcales bacterium]|nr:Na/Pi cotransporter family protein [Myxococcales bacterium]MCB9645010.1 Na/Pi cotransporter family protein [Deltaproteobacteria bacterium]